MTASKIAFSRMESIMQKKNMKIADLCRRLNVSSAYFANWRNRGLPANRFESVAAALGITIDQLVGNNEVPENAISVSLSGKIPVVGYAKLGDDGYFTDVGIYSESIGELNIPSNDPNAYALKCEGSSMAPRIQPGEFVIAEPMREAQPGDEVVVQDTNGRVMVKRFLFWREDQLYLGSVNTLQETIIIDKKQVRCIHPVLAIVPSRFLRIK